MQFSLAVLAALGAASSVVGQVALPSSIFGLPFGAQCQGAVLQTLTNGSFAQCFPADALLPLLSTNSSIIPILDDFMADLCYSQPCTQEALTAAAQTISTGCASDLQAGGLPNSTVSTAFSLYPVIREVLCLKTSDPYTEESYGGFLGPAPIPITPTEYNSTNGTFCVTSVLTQLSAYFDANVTLPFLVGAVTGANTTAVQLASEIELNILCNGCIVGALDIVESAFPGLLDGPIAAVFSALNMTSPLPADTSVGSLVNETCAYVPLTVSGDGPLPPNITVSIVNSTLPESPAAAPAPSA